MFRSITLPYIAPHVTDRGHDSDIMLPNQSHELRAVAIKLAPYAQIVDHQGDKFWHRNAIT